MGGQVIFFERSVKVHGFDDAPVVDQRDGSVEQGDNHQPGQSFAPGGGEDEDLADKTCHGRDTGQGEQTERRTRAQEGGAFRQTP